VPLDPSYPKARLAAMLEDARPAVLVTQAPYLDDLPEHGACTVCVDRDATKIGGCEASDLGIALHPDNAVYCIYTSGSTGAPKGVIGTYRALSNRFAWMERMYPGAKPQRVVHRSALNFVDSVAEIFAPLTQGDCVVIWTAQQVGDAGRQLAVAAESGINLLMSVPSILSVALEHEAKVKSELGDLRIVGVGGEATSALLCKRFRALVPGVRLLHLYGATETAADVMVYEIDASNESEERINAPIGRPISNMQVYVLDDWLEPVPVGVVGEIYLGGVGLARGYLNRPALTAERFVPNAFGEPGSRLYRTGDLGRWLDESTVDCLGRADQQVKVRGHRIELGEVEGALASHPGVKEAAVVAREYAEGDKRLVAYVVRRAGALLSVEGLRQWVGERLPGYMVPALWEWLEALPLTPNGKIDRKALPPPGEQLDKAAGYEAPRNETERLLVQVWEKVLKVKGVGVHHNFFDAGGDSMLLLRVQAELVKKQILDQEISVMNLFQYSTIRSLSEFLENYGP
jgi:nonribosomal peptide synthetase DhbF